jgi:hypothetical protein
MQLATPIEMGTSALHDTWKAYTASRADNPADNAVRGGDGDSLIFLIYGWFESERTVVGHACTVCRYDPVMIVLSRPYRHRNYECLDLLVSQCEPKRPYRPT